MAGDYIRRDFALAGTELYKYGEMEIEAVCAEYIQRLPAADVAPVVHGVWAEGDCDIIMCSCCEVEVDLGFLEPEDFKYCPHCGARMDGGEDRAGS